MIGCKAGGFSTPADHVTHMDDPMKIHDDLAAETNMSPDQLREFKRSDNFEAYADAKTGGEPPEEPVDDMIRLLETPADEYRDADDGFNEVEEGQQALSFLSRMKGNDQGEPTPGTDPPLSKRDMSLYAWGFDPDQNDGFLD